MMNNKIALYIHIPFCVSKCKYCDFLSFPNMECRQEYIDSLVREIKAFETDNVVKSIFIGGGTPSVIESSFIGQIFTALEKFTFDKNCEITIEANPGTLTEEKLKDYKSFGINRISIGLQAWQNHHLKKLGRIHTVEEFLHSYTMARKAGFDNINVDLMFDLPDQTFEEWKESLENVCALEPQHISAYSLIIEEGTPFSRKKLDLPDEDTEYRMYEDVAVVLKEYGYHQYEISNYAKAGCECRHNEGYWQRKDYLGLGLGAASLLGMERFSNTADMQEYLKNSSAPEKIRKNRELLTREDEMAEFMFLGLRMTQGVSKKEFQEYFGTAIENIYGEVLKKYKKQGLLLEESGRIFLSREGIHVSNAVMADFLL